MTEEEIKKQFDQIEKIYIDFRNKAAVLGQERNKMISDFLKDLENNKIEELRKIIVNL